MGRPAGRPPAWSARTTLTAVAIACALAIGGGLVIHAASGGSQDNGPAGWAARAVGSGRTGFPGDGARTVHSQTVVSDGAGGFTTELTQTGTITAASDTQLTVRSADGYVQTFRIEPIPVSRATRCEPAKRSRCGPPRPRGPTELRAPRRCYPLDRLRVPTIASVSFFEVIEVVGKTIDGVGVAVIAVGALISAAGGCPDSRPAPPTGRSASNSAAPSCSAWSSWLPLTSSARSRSPRMPQRRRARRHRADPDVPELLPAAGGHRLLAVAEIPPAAGRGRSHPMSKESRRARRKRWFDAVRKTPPEPLGPPDSHDQAEVAAMLREIGIALVEVEQPTQLVEGRLLQIAAQYTTAPVRVVVLPTMLMIQVGNVGYEVDGSTHSSLQLDMAGRIDDIASLAAVGAITPADAIAAIEAARTLRPRSGRSPPRSDMPSRQSDSAW